MEIRLWKQYGAIFVSIRNESERKAEFEEWLSVLDKWNFNRKPSRYLKYELPIETETFLYSEAFEQFCRGFFGDDVVIKKQRTTEIKRVELYPNGLRQTDGKEFLGHH